MLGAEARYSIILKGNVQEGCDVEEVKKKLLKFFNTSQEKIDQLFDNDRTVIKRNLLKSQAEKYKAVLESTGAQCLIKEDVNKEENKLGSQRQETDIEKKLNGLEKVSRFLLKAVRYNRRIMWGISLAIAVIAVFLGKTYYLDDTIGDAVKLKKTGEGHYSVTFKTEDNKNLTVDFNFFYPQRKIHLTQIKEALAAYYKDHKKYPKSSVNAKGNRVWDSIYSKGTKVPNTNWIAGLSPKYLPSLPKDPRNKKNWGEQYFYKSNGKDYKLIADKVQDVNIVALIDPLFIDPKRKTNAYGFWTKKATNW